MTLETQLMSVRGEWIEWIEQQQDHAQRQALQHRQGRREEEAG